MNVNLNNVTSLNPPPKEKKTMKRYDSSKEALKDVNSLKEKKMHFKDQLPKISKNDGGRNFLIFQPDRNKNMN
jgi:hypothetical protein